MKDFLKVHKNTCGKETAYAFLFWGMKIKPFDFTFLGLFEVPLGLWVSGWKFPDAEPLATELPGAAALSFPQLGEGRKELPGNSFSLGRNLQRERRVGGSPLLKFTTNI